MLLLIYAVAALMVSEFRYFSFKEIKLHQRHPFPVLLGLILLIMLTIGAPELMLFLGITSYALSAPAMAMWRLVRGRRRTGVSQPVPAPDETALRPVVLDKPGVGG
jgi:CDP-diacylglycerol--serine O-phosphatidyltransferase